MLALQRLPQAQSWRGHSFRPLSAMVTIGRSASRRGAFVFASMERPCQVHQSKSVVFPHSAHVCDRGALQHCWGSSLLHLPCQFGGACGSWDSSRHLPGTAPSVVLPKSAHTSRYQQCPWVWTHGPRVGCCCQGECWSLAYYTGRIYPCSGC